jgi:hypothetical protein
MATLRSYDDIANYIVEKIQLATVNVLTDEVFDSLSPHGSVYSAVPYFFSRDYPGRIEFVWNPPDELRILFVSADSQILHQFTFRRSVGK